MGSAGDLYVADTQNHTVRKIGPEGVVSTLAGLAGSAGPSGYADGTLDAARFNQPRGTAIDSAGNLYVADYRNHTIRKITTDGMVSTLAGWAGSPGSANGSGSAARFNFPMDVAVDSAGNVYVADSSNHTIRKITPGGFVSTLAGWPGIVGSADGPATTARFFVPMGVAVDSAGTVYVADSLNRTIRKITPAGFVSTLAGLAGNAGVADGVGSTARFVDPRGVAVDGSGTLYVADSETHRIRKITPEGVVSTLAGWSAGSADGTGSAARFNYPNGVTVDGAGNIFVADSGNSTIRKITPGGVVSTLGGLAGSPGSADGTGSAARFYNPAGVEVDSAGNLYVADSWNHTIRKGVPPSLPPSPNLPAEVLRTGSTSAAKPAAGDGSIRVQNGESTGALVLKGIRMGDRFQISIATLRGKTYVLEYKDSLNESEWKRVASVPGDGAVKFLTDPAATTSQRFYRVRVE
ncbi:MAG: SMP-30/gluconolactonase/LRE family protein [Verrucomicrobia bacterium]|nr:SMP-30/gluconolactonase/LRE family protein [Verrucomicrobiota bacterium]